MQNVLSYFLKKKIFSLKISLFSSDYLAHKVPVQHCDPLTSKNGAGSFIFFGL